MYLNLWLDKNTESQEPNLVTSQRMFTPRLKTTTQKYNEVRGGVSYVNRKVIPRADQWSNYC